MRLRLANHWGAVHLSASRPRVDEAETLVEAANSAVLSGELECPLASVCVGNDRSGELGSDASPERPRGNGGQAP